MITKSFSEKLNNISSELQMNPRDLLLVMFLESGVNPGSVNLHSKDPRAQARGLIQFMPDTLKGMGLSPAEINNFVHKSGEEQLDYVKQYVQSHRALIGGRPFTSATQYYVANFFPLALHRWRGTDPVANANKIVVSKFSKDPRERAAYNANTVLDYDKDGVIRVKDLTNTLMGLEKTKNFQNMLAQFNSVAGDGTVSDTRLKPRNRFFGLVKDDSMIAKFLDGLGNILDSFAADDIKKIEKYGSEYPQNKYLINIDSDDDFSSKLEFARILSIALKEEVDADSEIYTDGDNIQLHCALNVEKNRGKEVVEEFCAAFSNTFQEATKSIGGIKIYTFVSDRAPRYQKLDIKLSEINYRKFRLKFIK